MALNKDAVMWNTHYGLDIYALILRKYYKDELVLKLNGVYGYYLDSKI